ncbi:hypothetical protein, partial [Mycoplasmopsis primatum]
NKKLKDYGVVDETVTNSKFIKAIESAIAIWKYSNDTLVEKIYINDQENKTNLTNFETYRRIINMVCK